MTFQRRLKLFIIGLGLGTVLSYFFVGERWSLDWAFEGRVHKRLHSTLVKAAPSAEAQLGSAGIALATLRDSIHRFADLMKGKVIEPGATLSLNEAVGQRTEARGFVKAPVIYDSKYDEDVGGGVSQFAATMFNAAFFGGLDIPAYQMHSIAIDRYPYGREATISWTSPDLKIRNNTPYGVLVWPTYTDTSVTVTLYSTPFLKGDQTNQTKEPKGPCTKVTTERTRTAVADGKTSTDTFVGLYQPSEGVKCD